MITLKLFFNGGVGDFSGVGYERFFAAGEVSHPIYRVSTKGFAGRGRTVHTWRGQQARLKAGDIFGNMEDIGGYNSDR